ncbi:MAG TPA: topology modulation protein [Bacillaceae bacterium]
MQRIMVIGVSAGAGKSTLARKLGKALKIDVYHLDTLFWKPGWVIAPTEEFTAEQEEIVRRESWIMEGNYSGTFHIRQERADTIIYLELPLYTCYFRVVKRWLTHLGKTRPDMTAGCPEKLDWEFIKFIGTTYHRRKRNMKQLLNDLQKPDSGKQVIILSGKREIGRFLEQLEQHT